MMMLGGNATTAADGTFTMQERVTGLIQARRSDDRDTQTARGTVLETRDAASHGRRRRRHESRAHDIDGMVARRARWSPTPARSPTRPPGRFGVAARLVDPDAGAGPGGAPPPPPPPGAPGGGAIPTAAA